MPIHNNVAVAIRDRKPGSRRVMTPIGVDLPIARRLATSGGGFMAFRPFGIPPIRRPSGGCRRGQGCARSCPDRG